MLCESISPTDFAMREKSPRPNGVSGSRKGDRLQPGTNAGRHVETGETPPGKGRDRECRECREYSSKKQAGGTGPNSAAAGVTRVIVEWQPDSLPRPCQPGLQR